jgi:hypothetical protein
MLTYLAKRPGIWPLLLRFVLGKASLADGERGVSRAFGSEIKGVIVPDAGFGMDMDLPGDYERLETYVKKFKLGEE